jgi:hypothetical protein
MFRKSLFCVRSQTPPARSPLHKRPPTTFFHYRIAHQQFSSDPSTPPSTTPVTSCPCSHPSNPTDEARFEIFQYGDQR